ncbi:MAG: hypothetical protein LBV27_08610 [Oscillospiraceae bacterium]|jgi:hypothetical protein|nr:hypothetical protein [Oscillospiraceae bacterium]
MKGIVFRIGGANAVVMLTGGNFVNTRAKSGWQVGDVVTVSRQTRSRKMWAVLAACFALAISLGFGGYTLYYSQETLVSIDVNPSIELGINRFDRVISVTARNPEAGRIINAAPVKNMKYTDAVAALVSGGGLDPYLASDAFMLFTVQTKNADKQEALLSNLQEAADAAVLPHHQNLNTEYYAVDAQTVSNAHRHGMTAGKYSILMELQQVAPEIDISEYSHCSIDEIKGQIEMHAENGKHGRNSGGAGHGNAHH